MVHEGFAEEFGRVTTLSLLIITHGIREAITLSPDLAERNQVHLLLVHRVADRIKEDTPVCHVRKIFFLPLAGLGPRRR